MVSTVSEVTCSAPVNIAVVKYWGKRDTALLLPTNSSLSLTLSQDHLQSKTTLRLLAKGQDRLWLNGKEESISGSKRLSSVIQESRRIRAQYELLNPEAPRIAHLPMHICSVNNFPTAAGLASSASGFACLSFALYTALDLPLTLEELSRLARIGSGSACRSLFGGFVGWEMGTRDDGLDSMAYQVFSLCLIPRSRHKPIGPTWKHSSSSFLISKKRLDPPKACSALSKRRNSCKKDSELFPNACKRWKRPFSKKILILLPSSP